MANVYWLLLLTLMMLLLVSLLRIIYGPTAADRILAVQLFGTLGVAILLLYAQLLNSTIAQDIALVLALLASVSAIVFTRNTWARRKKT